MILPIYVWFICVFYTCDLYDDADVSSMSSYSDAVHIQGGSHMRACVGNSSLSPCVCG